MGKLDDDDMFRRILKRVKFYSRQIPYILNGKFYQLRQGTKGKADTRTSCPSRHLMRILEEDLSIARKREECAVRGIHSTAALAVSAASMLS